MIKRRVLLAFVFIGVFAALSFAEVIPKREFRGVWIHTVGNWKYRKMTAEAIQKEWTDMLDSFQKAGINAVIFQVRPQADAFYASKIEPWSRYLTGEQGKAPEPFWDPLAFMIEACHNRGMQLHAWLNPYRVTSSESEILSKTNKKHAKLFVHYGKQLYFDPGQPESRKIVNKVVQDIVSRYDVDGIHFDDYFYPYPEKGEEFNDNVSFKKFAKKQGFAKDDRANWRRNNVDVLIKEVYATVHDTKPWVVFGVSPFGIWRNIAHTSDGSGSKTNGLSNYDDLYADVLLWQKNRWVDYVAPQLYWKIGHKAADYATLIDWWSKNSFATNVYIGQSITTFNEKDLKNSAINQFAEKMRLTRETPNIQGNIWWSGYQLRENPFASLDTLANHYQKYPSLIPEYPIFQKQAPAPIKDLRFTIENCQLKMIWKPVVAKKEIEQSAYFCVYRFNLDEEIDLSKAARIVKIVRNPSYVIPDSKDKAKYIITALNRLFQESDPSEPVYVGE